MGAPAERGRSFSGIRAKALVRHLEDGAALSAAIDASSTQAAVAGAWGCSPVYVSQCCAGEHPLSWQKIRALPDGVFDALMEQEKARRDALREADAENHLALAEELADTPAGELLRGLSDGHLTRSEVEPIDVKASRMRRALAKWERLKQRVIRNGVVALVVGGRR